jgi:drug/metabolite transporter (DMT)-like permease
MYLTSQLLDLRTGGSSVLNQLSAALACLCVLGGATLLYRGFSIADGSQTVELVGGASLLTLGLMLFWPALKNWLEMKRYRGG